MLFARFLFSLFAANPKATVLSIRSKVGTCGYLKSASVLRCWTAFCAAIKADPSSASAADATTQSIILLEYTTGPLMVLGSPKYANHPATERARCRLRNDASDMSW